MEDTTRIKAQDCHFSKKQLPLPWPLVSEGRGWETGKGRELTRKTKSTWQLTSASIYAAS